MQNTQQIFLNGFNRDDFEESIIQKLEVRILANIPKPQKNDVVEVNAPTPCT